MKTKVDHLKRSTNLTNFQLDGLRNNEKTQIMKIRNEASDINQFYIDKKDYVRIRTVVQQQVG